MALNRKYFLSKCWLLCRNLFQIIQDRKKIYIALQSVCYQLGKPTIARWALWTLQPVLSRKMSSFLVFVGVSVSSSIVFLVVTIIIRLFLKYKLRLDLRRSHYITVPEIRLNSQPHQSLQTISTKLDHFSTLFTKQNSFQNTNNKRDFKWIDVVDFHRLKTQKSHISPVDLGFDWTKILPKAKQKHIMAKRKVWVLLKLIPRLSRFENTS